MGSGSRVFVALMTEEATASNRVLQFAPSASPTLPSLLASLPPTSYQTRSGTEVFWNAALAKLWD